MIIALIVIGIMGGTRVIKNAKISKLISETGDYTQQFNAFYDRYEAYPGDLSNSQAGGGGTDPTGIFGTMQFGHTINYGDGDGLIGGNTFENQQESASFFHHLYLSGIVRNPEFTGVLAANSGGVTINSNFPGTPFGSKSFFYAASSAVDGRYTRSNRISLATKDDTSINSMTPTDAESVDIKTDDGNPFKGKLISHNASVPSGSSENDNTCTDINGYNTDLTDPGCIIEKNLENKDAKFDPTFLAANPNFGDLGEGGAGDGNGTGENTDCRVTSVTNVASWIIQGGSSVSVGSLIATGTTIEGTCTGGYSGTPTRTCTDGILGGVVGGCSTVCTVPVATTYPGLGSWATVTQGASVDSGVTVTETCKDPGYTGTLQISCNGGTFSTISSCLAKCQVPTTDTYEGLANWNGVSELQLVNSGATVTGTCMSSGYSGALNITCNNGTFVPNSECIADNCREFAYTNGSQTFTVPNYTPAVTSVKIQVWGASGSGGPVGLGGYAYGTYSVSTGTQLFVHVGGTGSANNPGYNGGGNSGFWGSGGGATDIRTNNTSTLTCDGGDPRIITAGGGAGGGVSGNGNGGDTNAGGGGCGIGGGTGSNIYGAGGGGWYGGSAGAWSVLSRGGSSNVGGVSSGSMVQGVKSGNGFARICWGGTNCDGGSVASADKGSCANGSN
jgi:hypothetical protein